MSQDKKIVYMVLNCNPKKIAPVVILPATDYVVKQVKKHFKVKSYGKTASGMYNDSLISLIGSGMGAPATAMVMEALHRAGVQYIIRLDYCGGLIDDTKVGDIVLCSEAICGDGTTPHYLNSTISYPKVAADSNLTSLLEKELEVNNIRFHLGPIWSHDAIFKEPRELLNKARSHGAIAIDMETSVVFALGELFNIPTASILVVTDKPGGEGLENEDIIISPKVFQNLDKVIVRVLTLFSSITK